MRDRTDFKGFVDIADELTTKDIYEGLMALFTESQEVKKALAVYMYKKKQISIARAAEIAEVCYEEMKNILVENNIEIGLGPKDRNDAKKEHDAVREFIRNERNRK